MVSEQSDANIIYFRWGGIIYGDLTFSATNDPLANIAIPQKVLQGIADRHKAAEAEGDDDILIMDPSLGGEASPQPLAMIPPPSTSVIPITSNSAPQTTEDSQADDDVESQVVKKTPQADTPPTVNQPSARAVSISQSTSLGKRPTSSAPPKWPLFVKKAKKTAPPPSLGSEIIDFSKGPILGEPCHTNLRG
ncbi:hypothetical protein LIER_26010 [Lithospermum erythrorhizon]|uniref:Uncharacterized protein n=1 Tax=Lithospermum erythrorhizon TaxID=34254 RepID=A0AAV3R851_LITER